MAPDWPAPDGTEAQQLELYKARLAEVAAQRQSAERSDPRHDAVDDQFFGAYYEVLSSRIAQSRSTAETLQRAAAAIATFYGAALGIAFSVGEHPLPARAVLPLAFVGLAIVASTVYLAWQGPASRAPIPMGSPNPPAESFARSYAYLLDFQAIVKEFVRRRDNWLRAAIVALGIGLVLIPVPFVDIDTRDAPEAPGSVPVEDQLAAVEPPWPRYGTTGPVRVEDRPLRAALYAAQVAEVGREREAALARARATPPDPAVRLRWLPETGWAILGVVLFAVVLGVAAWPSLERAVREWSRTRRSAGRASTGTDAA